MESLDRADAIRDQLGRPSIRRVFVVNRVASNTRRAREAKDELPKTGGELAGVVHQRVAFPDSASRGQSVMASRASDAAAQEITTLWHALKGDKHGSQSQEAKPQDSEKRAKTAAEKLGEGEKRMFADVPERIHRQLRVKCLERGVLVRDYVLELLAKDGIQ